MKKQDFNFELPAELIAQYPLTHRSDSRLLCYSRATQTITHALFKDITEWLLPGDLLVMNNTEVIPARMYGVKASGGQIELLVERILDRTDFLAHIKASKSPKPGSLLYLEHGYQLRVVAKHDDLYHCSSIDHELETVLQQVGHIPLPPYIHRTDESLDKARYQTIYARHKGSVAAPTAGLHFDEDLFINLKQRGVNVAYVTLHVGAGTFRPVRCEHILEHKMHKETFVVNAELCEAVNRAKAEDQRVIAVGTTALRCLESLANTGQLLQPCSGETDIFIYPGYQFKICDGLITNFHLPESTLMMLVAAFIGLEQTQTLYQTAIAERYRFFSYGDACLLL